MRKVLLVLITIISTSALLLSQTSIGLKGGINLANLAVNKDQIDNVNMKLGLTAGAFIRTSISDNDWLMIQPEICYTLKGAKYQIGETEVKANLHYLDIPAAAVIRLFNSPLTIHAGPQFSLLLKPEYKYTSTLLGENTILDDNRDNYRQWDFSVFAGIGIDIENLVLEVRLSRGLRNVEEARTILNTLFIANDTKNFGISVTAGILF